MSVKDARARVWSLYQRPGTPLQFEEALDDYVHQLAEEIRARGVGFVAGDMAIARALMDGYREAADLIDPMVR